MAVENKYVDANLALGKLADGPNIGTAEVFAGVAIAAIAAADDDGSIYRLFKSLPGSLIPLQILITNDALTSGTDYDLGFYEPSVDGVTGAVIDKDALMDGTSMSSARAEGAGVSGLTATATIPLASAQKKIFELCGHTDATKKSGYDLALTANTVGSSAGSIVVKALFIQG